MMNYFKVMFEYKLNDELTQKHIVANSEKHIINDELENYLENHIEHDADYKANTIIINMISESDFEKHPEFMKVYF